jgi:Mce-associated membrane protein
VNAGTIDSDPISSNESSTAVTNSPDSTAKPKTGLRRILFGVLGVLIIVFAIVVGFMLPGYLDDRASEQARIDAPEAAARQAEAMLGYQFDTVETELPKAAEGLTGDFKDEYTQLIEQAIIPGAKDKQLTVKVSVQAKSVVDAGPDDATVLLFLNQVTTGKDTPQAVTSGSRIRMSMHKEDGVWLTSDLTPL